MNFHGKGNDDVKFKTKNIFSSVKIFTEKNGYVKFEAKENDDVKFHAKNGYVKFQVKKKLRKISHKEKWLRKFLS